MAAPCCCLKSKEELLTICFIIFYKLKGSGGSSSFKLKRRIQDGKSASACLCVRMVGVPTAHRQTEGSVCIGVRIVGVPIDKRGVGARASLYKNSGCAHRQTEGLVCICVSIVGHS